MLKITVVITLLLIISVVLDTIISLLIIMKNKAICRETRMVKGIFIRHVISEVLNVLAAIMFIYYLLHC